MRAFISYSINDTEQYILTLLAKKLKGQDFTVTASYNGSQNAIDLSNINKAHLFIGIITKTGLEKKKVLSEWKYAKRNKIPSLLLIENTIALSPRLKRNAGIVIFDKHNPEPSIQLVKNKLGNKQTRPSANPGRNTAWLLGGLAIVSLITLLSDND